MRENDYIHIERNAEEIQEFIIKPKYQIGTELWFMFDNKPKLALVAEIVVTISSYDHREKNNQGWLHQLYNRWLHRNQKSYWNYTYNYRLKIDGEIGKYYLSFGEEKKDKKQTLYINERECFFSKEELLKSLYKNE